MVRVRGQLDAPLVDIETVKHEYWNRKTVYLPSLAKYQKQKGWRGWFQKKQTPMCVIRRLTDEEWRQVDEKFYSLKRELAKNQNLLNKLTTKMMEGKKLTEKQMKVMNHHMSLAMPVYYGMLELMIEEPDLDFEGVTIGNIGDDMTQDQKEKAQEVVVPVILTRIATMAAYVFRRSL